MKIAYITAGAAGMFCGSCMKDNTLVATLQRLGHDALLIPTYTPITTDEESVAESHIYMGGVNVYLQQKSWIFRHTPRFLDRLLDFPRLLRWVSRFASRTKYEDLGDLTISMLLGRHGKQDKEIERLVYHITREFQPDAIVLTNVLLSGVVPALRKQTNVPIVATLQGDDIFLEALHAKDRERAIELIGTNCADLSGLIATSQSYATAMASYLRLPAEKMIVVAPGISLKSYENIAAPSPREEPVIGCLARICPEKGFDRLIDAFIQLHQLPDAKPCQLRVSGWLGDNQREYFARTCARLREHGLESQFHYVDTPTLKAKIAFLQDLDLFVLPAVYHEPKGIPVLEALACGVPVVVPDHGAFPELVEQTHGGWVVAGNQVGDFAQTMHRVLQNPAHCREVGQTGRRNVFQYYSAEVMAQRTVDYLTHLAAQVPAPQHVTTGA
ncbi:MAG: glycosyltransferase family 4 protein [Zavarzinella sp.]